MHLTRDPKSFCRPDPMSDKVGGIGTYRTAQMQCEPHQQSRGFPDSIETSQSAEGGLGLLSEHFEMATAKIRWAIKSITQIRKHQPIQPFGTQVLRQVSRR